MVISYTPCWCLAGLCGQVCVGAGGRMKTEEDELCAGL